MAAPAPASVILRLELQGGAVDAVAQPALIARAVVEDVTQVPLAARADDLGADHAVRGVAMLLDRAVFGAHEARPARAAVELGTAFEQGLPAPGAGIFAGSFVLLVLAGERPLGAVLTQDLVLLRRQPLAPFGIGQVDLVGQRESPSVPNM